MGIITSLAQENGIVIRLDKVAFILNDIHEQPSHIINFICVMLKQYIYRCRCRGKIPKKEQFLVELEVHHNAELANAKVCRRLESHRRWWRPIVEFHEVVEV